MGKQTSKRGVRLTDSFQLQDSDMEIIRGVSQTKPDDSFTIRQLLTKYTNGVDPSVTKLGYYQDDVDFDDPDMQQLLTMDLVDLNEMREVENLKRKKLSEAINFANQQEQNKIREDREAELKNQLDLFMSREKEEPEKLSVSEKSQSKNS